MKSATCSSTTEFRHHGWPEWIQDGAGSGSGPEAETTMVPPAPLTLDGQSCPGHLLSDHRVPLPEPATQP